MGTIAENSAYWTSCDWKQGGDEWSEVWSGTRNLWWATLYPRIRNYIPAPAILEIAPGFGRFTQFLKEFCKQLIIVDVTEKCIIACKERFAGCDHISYHVNDDRALDMVGDRLVDFAFSFDSLVHVEADTIGAYLSGSDASLNPTASVSSTTPTSLLLWTPRQAACASRIAIGVAKACRRTSSPGCALRRPSSASYRRWLTGAVPS